MIYEIQCPQSLFYDRMRFDNLPEAYRTAKAVAEQFPHSCVDIYRIDAGGMRVAVYAAGHYWHERVVKDGWIVFGERTRFGHIMNATERIAYAQLAE